MLQIAGLILAFLAIVLLVLRRVPLYLAMLAGIVIISAVGIGSPEGILEVALSSLSDRTTLELLAALGLIGILSRLMRNSGLLDRMVWSLQEVLRSTRATLGVVPALFGCLPVPGGAILSAPIVDRLGERSNLPPVQRCAVNMVYRHIVFFTVPFLPNLVLTSSLSGVPLMKLAAYQLPLAAAAAAGGWFAYLRRIAPGSHFDPATEGNDTKGANRRFRSAVDFVAAAFPLLLAIVLTLLGIPFWLALLGGAGIALLMSIIARRSVSGLGALLSAAATAQRQLGPDSGAESDLMVGSDLQLDSGSDSNSVPDFNKSFGFVHSIARSIGSLFRGLRLVMASADLPLLGAVAGIMVFRGVVGKLEALPEILGGLSSVGIPLNLLFFVLSVVVGTVTSSVTATLAISFAILTPMVQPGTDLLPFAILVNVGGFVGYFLSPIHLCQILCLEYFQVHMGDLYRQYVIPLTAVTIALVGVILLIT
ncbi:MAG: DUF401 family protein [Firmicutes bacterium]|nr:DUF401 family protein [Bacillota bacterium]